MKQLNHTYILVFNDEASDIDENRYQLATYKYLKANGLVTANCNKCLTRFNPAWYLRHYHRYCVRFLLLKSALSLLKHSTQISIGLIYVLNAIVGA